MKFDSFSLCILALLAIIAIVVAWPYIKSSWNKQRKKDSLPNEAGEIEAPIEDETFPMARATNDTQVLNYTPKEEELDQTQDCVAQSEEQVVFAIDQESDYTVFLLKNVPKKKFHEAILGLMKSRMEITNLNGEKISMEEILSEAGEAEEPIKQGDKKRRVTDPEPKDQRSVRFALGIKQLKNNKPRKKHKNG